eukprot:TRINITY_DN38963_c0_g1_i1.p1 TRINITY_DN38963_c0_g1~~TRINITY_DN38963_c0_g1_i1.p1  ORF type:complete len:417 (+),score=82.58 TRINITY_DN38963_c0_g1_i1:86-1336(+)
MPRCMLLPRALAAAVVAAAIPHNTAEAPGADQEHSEITTSTTLAPANASTPPSPPPAAWPLGLADPEKHKDHSHALPPWWILAGVHPQGPSVDMGGYDSAGFSKQQQARFGVDERGKIKDWQRFEAATKSLQPCMDPSAQQMGLDESHFMLLLGRALEKGWKEATNEDPELHRWTQLRSPCQRNCMTRVLSWSLRTLWAVGELLSKGGGRKFSAILAHSVRACYPGFRSARADEVAEKVSKIVSLTLERELPQASADSNGIAGGDVGSASSRRLEGPSCLVSQEQDRNRMQFLLKMELSVDNAVNMVQERSWTMMEQASRPCQKICRRAVVRQVVETLYDTGLLSRGNSDALTLEALQGALGACLPNLPEGAGQGLATEALMQFETVAFEHNAPATRRLQRSDASDKDESKKTLLV